MVLASLLTFLCGQSYGQFAIVSDKDGYCNVRRSPETGNNIADTLSRGHFVYCFDSQGNWTSIDYVKRNRDRHGYVYNDRLKFIDEYKRIPLISRQNSSSIFGNDSIRVVITEQRFDKSRYRFSYYKDNKEQIELINGKKYYGEDGGQPSTEYKSITITKGTRKISLPKSALENLFEPNYQNLQVNYDHVNDIIYIQSMNSDGAGGYEVIWKIEKGVYRDRFVANGF
jgi:hypothetical protein